MRTLDGGEIRIQVFKKLAAYGTALFLYDAVARNASGGLDKVITPGTTLYSGVTLKGGAASTETEHPIVVSPGAVFVAQMSGAFAEVDEGLNANLTLGAGSAVTGLSAHQVDYSTINTSNALDVKAHQAVQDPTNEYGNYCRTLITFNKHRNAPGVAGV